MPESIIIVAVVAVVLIIVLIGVLSEKARVERLKAFAEANGYAFYPSGDPTGEPQGCSFSFMGTGYGYWFRRFEGFSPFGTGHSQNASNLFVATEDDRSWYFFDYKYTTGSGKNQSTYYYWVAAVEMKCGFPKLDIRREGFFDKVGAVFGVRDIGFESNEFNDMFHVSCADEKFAYHVVHPRMMEFLMAGFDRNVQLGGPYLVLHDSGSLDTGMLEPTRMAMVAFLSHIPDYVWKDYGG